jgi:phosphoribosylanthranilate isomerase
VAVLTQIYGLTTPDDMRDVCRLGVDHVGIVVADGFETWDEVDADAAVAIRAEVGPGVRTVALSISADAERVGPIVELLKPDIAHVVRTDDVSTEELAALRRAVAPVELMATLAVRDAGAADQARSLAPAVDWLLLDTAHPESGVVGATGLVHDWAHSAAVVEAVDVPVVLAGGLGPHNVADAIRAVRPAGVDSETRTSQVGDRRRKDVDAVRRFVEATKEAGAGVSPRS